MKWKFIPSVFLHLNVLLENWLRLPFHVDKVPLRSKFYIPLSESVKRWISKSYSHYWKGFKYTKMLENQRICGSWRIFLKNSRQFNCSAQTRDSWTTITKQKTQLWIIQVTTQCWFKGVQTFKRGHLYKFNYYFLMWTTCKHLLCEISYSGQYWINKNNMHFVWTLLFW